MNDPNLTRIEITNDDLIQALAQKEVQIIGLNKRIAELQAMIANNLTKNLNRTPQPDQEDNRQWRKEHANRYP